MISANGGLPAHRYTPQVTQRWPRGSEPASVFLLKCPTQNVGNPKKDRWTMALKGWSKGMYNRLYISGPCLQVQFSGLRWPRRGVQEVTGTGKRRWPQMHCACRICDYLDFMFSICAVIDCCCMFLCIYHD